MTFRNQINALGVGIEACLESLNRLGSMRTKKALAELEKLSKLLAEVQVLTRAIILDTRNSK